jgi:hypothetical protein
VRFVVFAAVTMKNVAFWDVTPCALAVNYEPTHAAKKILFAEGVGW